MTIDSTKAGTQSNSYSSINDADDYFESTYGKTYWKDLTDQEKEALLITATRAIERLRVKYPSISETQRLKFPVNTFNRTDQESRPLGDGYDKVKEATRSLIFALIGLVIVFLSPTIVKFVIDKFL